MFDCCCARDGQYEPIDASEVDLAGDQPVPPPTGESKPSGAAGGNWHKNQPASYALPSEAENSPPSTPTQTLSQNPQTPAAATPEQRDRSELYAVVERLEKLESSQNREHSASPSMSPEPDADGPDAVIQQLLRKVFKLFDISGQGMLTGYELFLIYRQIGGNQPYTRDEADEALVKLIRTDVNNISEEEFAERRNHNLILENHDSDFIKAVKKGGNDAELRKAVMDQHKKYEDRKSQMEELFRTIDLSDDGYVTEHELLALSKAVSKGKPKKVAAGGVTAVGAAVGAQHNAPKLQSPPAAFTAAAFSEPQLFSRNEQHKPISKSQFLTYYRSVIYDLDDKRFKRGIESFMTIARRAQSSNKEASKKARRKKEIKSFISKLYEEIRKQTSGNNSQSTAFTVGQMRQFGNQTKMKDDTKWVERQTWEVIVTEMTNELHKTSDKDEISADEWSRYCTKHQEELSKLFNQSTADL